MERLQQYDFHIEHRKGVQHPNADALSRRPCPENCGHCVKREARDKDKVELQATTIRFDGCWDPLIWTKAQEDDEDLELLLAWKQACVPRPGWNQISNRSPTTKSYWSQWDSLIIDNGLLKRVWESNDGHSKRLQVVVSRTLTEEVLKEVHNGASGGHLGIRKTLEKVRERFYWVGCRSDVEDYCAKCHQCAASKGPRKKRRGQMKLYNVGAPFERIAIDVTGPFPISDAGNRYILVVTDYFTKWPEAYALPNQEATTIAETLVSEYVSRYGVPLELHSDQGRNFESAVFQDLCKLLGIRKTRTTALHPQSDGMVERFNRTMKNHLRMVVSDHQKDWDRHLPIFLMAYRSAVHETIGCTPARVLFGRELRLLVDLAFGHPDDKVMSIHDYCQELIQRLDSIHNFVRKRLKIESDRMKARYDIQCGENGYSKDDQVWLYNPSKKKGLSPKLQNVWDGPYRIVKRISDIVYQIQRSPRTKMKVVHIDRLAPYQATDHDRPSDRDDQY